MHEKDTDFNKRVDAAILAHVELYRLTLVEAVRRSLLAEIKCSEEKQKLIAAEAIQKLVSDKKLVARDFPPAAGCSTGELYYVLPTVKSSRGQGDSQAIDFDLQTLWLSTLSEKRFYRLTLAEIRQLFSAPPHHHVRHVIGDCGDGPCVYRIYPSKVGIKETLARLKQFIGEARTRYKLATWLDCGDYGFCITVDNHCKVESISDAVMSKRQGAGAFADQVRVQVAFAPTAANVSESIGDL